MVGIEYTAVARDSVKRIQRAIHSAGSKIINSSIDESGFGSDNDLDIEEDESTANIDTFRAIEEDIAYLKYEVLPFLPHGDVRKDVEYGLYVAESRLKNLYATYRYGKVQRRKRELQSVYVNSFYKNELSIKRGELTNKNTEEDLNVQGDRKYDGNGGLDDTKLQKLTAQERLLKQNTQLSGKLQNVNAMMRSTLLAGEINLSELEISTSTLSRLADHYSLFGDVLNRTNVLVKTINKASKSERAMIYRSLYFFMAVCAWILWRRIFKRPILLVLWLLLSPLKLVWRSSSSPSNAQKTIAEVISQVEATISATIEDALSTTLANITDVAITTTTEIISHITKDEL